MTDPHQNERLNSLLIRLYRSLLQYSVDCWPWTGSEEGPEQQLLARLAATRQQHVQRLVDLLLERGWQVDFGAYPEDYSDLHYVALEYLVKALVANETDLIAIIEREQTASSADPEVASLLADILAAERENVQRLKQLESRAPAAAS